MKISVSMYDSLPYVFYRHGFGNNKKRGGVIWKNQKNHGCLLPTMTHPS